MDKWQQEVYDKLKKFIEDTELAGVRNGPGCVVMGLTQLEAYVLVKALEEKKLPQ